MNPYDVLGVSPAATMDEVQARYRLLLREFHPDLHQGASPEQLAEAEAMTRNLNLAIKTLRDSLPVKGASTTWERPRRDDSGRGTQWAGESPFWRADDAPPSATGETDESDFRSFYYDWFGNPIDYGTDDPVPCPFCGKPYARLDDYEVHLEQVHRYRPHPPAPRVRKPPGQILATVGKLRFVPAWMAMLLAIAIWMMFGHVAFTGALFLVALVLWTQTSPRFRW